METHAEGVRVNSRGQRHGDERGICVTLKGSKVFDPFRVGSVRPYSGGVAKRSPPAINFTFSV